MLPGEDNRCRTERFCRLNVKGSSDDASALATFFDPLQLSSFKSTKESENGDMNNDSISKVRWTIQYDDNQNCLCLMHI